jgi:hypothetical protein
VGEKRCRREAVPLIRLHFVVEGQTEESFVNDLLAPVLATENVFSEVHCVTTGRHHGQVFRGGFVNYEHLARDLVLWMKQDQNEDSWFTTMIDLFRSPFVFPGKNTLLSGWSARDRIRHLETAMLTDISARLGGLPISSRLIPYIQLHEFEAILFSDPNAFFEAFPGDKAAVGKLVAIKQSFQSPEDINDGPTTAPSKRILSILSDFQKNVGGIIIAQRIGLSP